MTTQGTIYISISIITDEEGKTAEKYTANTFQHAVSTADFSHQNWRNAMNKAYDEAFLLWHSNAGEEKSCTLKFAARLMTNNSPTGTQHGSWEMDISTSKLAGINFTPTFGWITAETLLDTYSRWIDGLTEAKQEQRIGDYAFLMSSISEFGEWLEDFTTNLAEPFDIDDALLDSTQHLEKMLDSARHYALTGQEY